MQFLLHLFVCIFIGGNYFMHQQHMHLCVFKHKHKCYRFFQMSMVPWIHWHYVLFCLCKHDYNSLGFGCIIKKCCLLCIYLSNLALLCISYRGFAGHVMFPTQFRTMSSVFLFLKYSAFCILYNSNKYELKINKLGMVCFLPHSNLSQLYHSRVACFMNII
jgi:hypothetical protein